MITFKEFIEEAKRIKVLRTAHYTSASNKSEIMKSGFRDSLKPDFMISLLFDAEV